MPGPGGLTFYTQTFWQQRPRPFPVSPLQSFALVP